MEKFVRYNVISYDQHVFNYQYVKETSHTTCNRPIVMACIKHFILVELILHQLWIWWCGIG